jgi:putative heme-binding domain-containing protein
VSDDKELTRLAIACSQTLPEIDYLSLSPELKLDYLRAVSLGFARQPAMIQSLAGSVLTAIEPDYPSGNAERDRELCQMLVHLDSPTVVEKTVAMMKREPTRQNVDMTELLERNTRYARAFNEMRVNQPDKQQIWYAFCLRVAKSGWTPETRADYFRWFGKAQKWAGGNSFRKFLQNIENQAYEGLTENERVMLVAAGARTPFKMPELPNPKGPGKEWTLGEVRSLASDLKHRDFANGKKMFAATRCIVCHRFAGDGGATGPDLTQLAGRFNIDALTEAIMEPSKIISDQYVASLVYTADGRTISGRIVSENARQISILTDPEDSTKVVDIDKDNIEDVVASKTSIMPSNLLNQLNEDEVMDLMAYLLSRGDKDNVMFKK